MEGKLVKCKIIKLQECLLRKLMGKPRKVENVMMQIVSDKTEDGGHDALRN